MLWTDGIFITPEDLYSICADINQIASTESIELSGPRGSIAQGIHEAALELETTLQSFSFGIYPTEFTAGHWAAVTNIGQGTGPPTGMRLAFSQIIVTSPTADQWSPLRRWVAYKVLGFFFMTAGERKTNDRYGDTWTRLEQELERRWQPYLMASGIPFVTNPLARPGAIFEPESGTFDKDDLSAVVGGADPAQSYDVAITYTGAKYVNQLDKQNAESAPTDRAQISLPSGNYLRVSITRLKPPSATQPAATRYRSTYLPMAATGWNIYVGSRKGTLYLQNPSPLPLATTSYTFSGAPTLMGYMAGLGQYPDQNAAVQRTLMRG